MQNFPDISHKNLMQRFSSWSNKGLDILTRLRSSKRMRSWAFIIAFTLFIIGLTACFLAVPDILTRVNYGPFLIVLLIGVPLTLLLNAVEIVLTGQLIDKEFDLVSALKISIFGTAANMLPLPGGAVVRIAALKDKGAGLGEGTRATFAVGIMWLGVSLLYSGLWMVPFAKGLGIITAIVGVITLFVGIGLGLSKYRKIMTIFRIIILKTIATILVTLRLIFCLLAVGTAVNFPEAATMTAANVIGSALMIVPAGIGINEAMTALLAQVVGVSAAIGFLAAVVNRLAGLVLLCPVTLYLYIHKPKSTTP